MLRERYMTPKPATEPNLTNAQIEQRLLIFNPITMPTCDKLHHSKMCDVDWRCWARDFYDQDADSDYESQYETETDMNQRLGDTEYDSEDRGYGAGQGFAPSSSMGPNYR